MKHCVTQKEQKQRSRQREKWGEREKEERERRKGEQHLKTGVFVKDQINTELR